MSRLREILEWQNKWRDSLGTCETIEVSQEFKNLEQELAFEFRDDLLRKVIEELTLSNSGKFFNYDGSEIFW